MLFGSELKALRAHPGFERGDRPRCAGGLPAPRLRAGAAHHLPQRPQAAAGRTPHIAAATASRGSSAVLGPARVAVAGASAPEHLDATRGDGRASRGTLRRRREAAHDCRRAARRVPVGRHQFLDRRRADAGAARPARSRPSRSASAKPSYDEARPCPRRRRHLGTEHTELYVDARRRARRDPGAARDLRRALRRPARRSRPIFVSADPPSTSPWRCRATAAMSCSRATTATAGAGRPAWRRMPAAAAPGHRPRRCARIRRRAWDAASARIPPSNRPAARSATSCAKLAACPRARRRCRLSRGHGAVGGAGGPGPRGARAPRTLPATPHCAASIPRLPVAHAAARRS